MPSMEIRTHTPTVEAPSPQGTLPLRQSDSSTKGYINSAYEVDTPQVHWKKSKDSI